MSGWVKAGSTAIERRRWSLANWELEIRVLHELQTLFLNGTRDLAGILSRISAMSSSRRIGGGFVVVQRSSSGHPPVVVTTFPFFGTASSSTGMGPLLIRTRKLKEDGAGDGERK